MSKRETNQNRGVSVPDATTVTRHVLPNGLVVLVRENHVTPSVVVSGYLQVGALLEPLPKAGLAAFSAAMLRRGTEKRTFAEINETLDAVGASIGIGGGRHVSEFGGKCLREDLDLLLEILSDVLRHPVFPAEHVEKVRGQILTGLQERDNDTRSMASLAFRATLFGPDHPYGHSLSGEKETVSAITRDDIADFYTRTYGPARGALVIVGDVETKSLLARLSELLGDWHSPSNAPTGEVPPAPALTEMKESRVTIPGKTQTDLVLGWLGLSRDDPDYYAAILANTILGRFGMMGRLGDNVREKQGLAYYAYSTLEAGSGAGPWMAVAGVNPDNVERTRQSILEEITRMRDTLVPDDELADSKAFMTGILPLRLETNQGVSDTLADIERFELGLDYLNRYPDLIGRLTAEDVRAVVERFLQPEAYALGIAGPEMSDA